MLKKLSFFTVGVLLCYQGIAQSKKQLLEEVEQLKLKVEMLEKSPEVNLDTEFEKFSYAIGINIAESLKGQGVDSIDTDAFSVAVNDFQNGAPKMSAQEINQVIQAYLASATESKSKVVIEEGKKFLENNAKREGVVVLPSGLQYEVLKAGEGQKPKATDKVTTHYHGTLIDGTVFDSSVERGQPATFPVNGVIQGWVEALQLMQVGSKWKLFVPYNLAYGDRGAGPKIGPFTTLVFEVELLSIDN